MSSEKVTAEEFAELRAQMRNKSRAETVGILTLADLRPSRMWELANGYWPASPRYDDVRWPWWLAQTSIGLNRENGYDLRVDVDACSEWSATSGRVQNEPL